MQKKLKLTLDLFLSAGKYLEATKLLERELFEKSNNQEILFNLGVYWFAAACSERNQKKQKYLGEAKKALKKTISVNSESSTRFLAKAKLNEFFGDADKALRYYRRAYI